MLNGKVALRICLREIQQFKIWLLLLALGAMPSLPACRQVSGRGLISEEAPAQVSKPAPRTASGCIIDAKTGRPIAHATLFHSGKAVFSDAEGNFSIAPVHENIPLLAKASGYRQTSLPIPDSGKFTVRLNPFNSHGLYLTHYGVGTKILRDPVLDLMYESGLNTLVIDVKGDRGYLSYKYDIPRAREIGALKVTTLRDIKAFLRDMHGRGIYVIGRVVVFKDDLLAAAHPEWAVIDTRTEKPWLDNEKLAWVDPFHEEVWRYNIDIARAAAQAGFDEIQFDYVRFPTDGKVSAARYSRENNAENRVTTINRFLETAAKELLPFNVYFSADVFGYVPWNFNDTDIGQSLPELARYVDYICLMVYPSGYHLGIPQYRKPVEHPREVVYNTLEQAKKRLNGQAEKLRPWLQNFRDYAFDRRPFTGEQIRLQIQACTQAKTSGWLLWDASNKYRYTADALRSQSLTEIRGAGASAELSDAQNIR